MNSSETEKMSEITSIVKEALAKADSESDAGKWLASQSATFTEGSATIGK